MNDTEAAVWARAYAAALVAWHASLYRGTREGPREPREEADHAVLHFRKSMRALEPAPGART